MDGEALEDFGDPPWPSGEANEGWNAASSCSSGRTSAVRLRDRRNLRREENNRGGTFLDSARATLCPILL